MRIVLLVIVILLAGCASSPEVVEPIAPASSETLPEAQSGSGSEPATPGPEPGRPEITQTETAELTQSISSLPDPRAYQWVEVAGGFTRPLDLQHAGDERMFIVEQRGLIWVISGGVLQPEPFLDIRDRVNDGANEQGLLGLAFHPAYAENGYFYVNYTQADDSTVIARFSRSGDPDQADPASEVRLLGYDQPYRNHNGGGLAFGPDGMLYIGTGDGGSANDPQGNGQRLDTLLGKLLRLDVDAEQPYAIPADNPFIRTDARPEIWAYGLRNPFRFSFDHANGDLYLGDVGQNAWEEINFQPANSPGGENYGWNIREGAHPFAGEQTEGLVDPVAEYGHDRGCSVTGGHVIRSAALPEWTGVYLFGDYCSGLVWGLLQAEEGTWQNQLLFETGSNISSFGLDSNGDIYLIDHGGGIFRLEPKP